jgi:hypothetical protein
MYTFVFHHNTGQTDDMATTQESSVFLKFLGDYRHVWITFSLMTKISQAKKF